MMQSISKSFFTVAKGKKYLHLAFTLARSFRFYNREIPFYIIVDSDFNLPYDLKWVNKKIVHSALLENGVLFKLNFSSISPTEISIFIDADSIVYSNIEHLFQYAESINVIGNIVKENEEWLGFNLQNLKNEYKIEKLVRYCGAFYIINNTSKKTSLILEKAESLLKDQNLNKFHHSGLNEEAFIGVAMAMLEANFIEDDGNIWSDLGQYKPNFNLNVFNGKCEFENLHFNENYKNWLPEGKYSPSILHIGGALYNKNPWLFDSTRLKLYYKYKITVPIANILTYIFVKKPYSMLKLVKSL